MIDIEKAAAIRAARTPRVKTATQKTSAPAGTKGNKTQRQPSKIHNAGTSTGSRLINHSGRKPRQGRGS